MPAFYLTLVAVLLAGIGARDQVTVAGLALRQGQRPAILVVALMTTAVTAVLAGYAAWFMLKQLPPPARTIFAAIALGMAGVESLVLAPRRNPREPTHSLGALLLVLLAHQITDSVRFVIFGMGVGLAGPIPAAAAGLLGGSLLVGFGWLRPDLPGMPVARRVRRLIGLALALVALVIFLREVRIV
jgi:hypothetical protein